MTTAVSEPLDSDVVRIVAVSDVRIGAFQENPQRLQDPLLALSSVFSTAISQKADLVLFLGNLFASPSPSPDFVAAAIRCFRDNVTGPGDTLEVHRTTAPDDLAAHCNWIDPSVDIALPCAAIFGALDAPATTNQSSALHTLHAAGYLSLLAPFGTAPGALPAPPRAAPADSAGPPPRLAVRPLVFRKGRTCVALYPLGYVPHSLLASWLADGEVTVEVAQPADRFFHIFAVHHPESVTTAVDDVAHPEAPAGAAGASLADARGKRPPNSTSASVAALYAHLRVLLGADPLFDVVLVGGRLRPLEPPPPPPVVDADAATSGDAALDTPSLAPPPATVLSAALQRGVDTHLGTVYTMPADDADAGAAPAPLQSAASGAAARSMSVHVRVMGDGSLVAAAGNGDEDDHGHDPIDAGDAADGAMAPTRRTRGRAVDALFDTTVDDVACGVVVLSVRRRQWRYERFPLPARTCARPVVLHVPPPVSRSASRDQLLECIRSTIGRVIDAACAAVPPHPPSWLAICPTFALPVVTISVETSVALPAAASWIVRRDFGPRVANADDFITFTTKRRKATRRPKAKAAAAGAAAGAPDGGADSASDDGGDGDVLNSAPTDAVRALMYARMPRLRLLSDRAVLDAVMDVLVPRVQDSAEGAQGGPTAKEGRAPLLKQLHAIVTPAVEAAERRALVRLGVVSTRKSAAAKRERRGAGRARDADGESDSGMSDVGPLPDGNAILAALGAGGGGTMSASVDGARPRAAGAPRTAADDDDDDHALTAAASAEGRAVCGRAARTAPAARPTRGVARAPAAPASRARRSGRGAQPVQAADTDSDSTIATSSSSSASSLSSSSSSSSSSGVSRGTVAAPTSASARAAAARSSRAAASRAAVAEVRERKPPVTPTAADVVGESGDGPGPKRRRPAAAPVASAAGGTTRASRGAAGAARGGGAAAAGRPTAPSAANTLLDMWASR